MLEWNNAVNEIAGNGGNSIASSGGTPDWADPDYDDAGNMTTIPSPQSPTSSLSLTYDAYYDYPISTGPLEGTNNKIKTMKRQAYGFRDAEFLKLKIYAIHQSKNASAG